MKKLGENNVQSPKEQIALHKEVVTVSKRKKLKASYKFKKFTNSYETKRFISLDEENVTINEIVKNEELKEYPQVSINENTTIIPIVKEIEVITKKLILVKEIHITKNTHTETKEIPVQTREELFEVQKIVE